MRLRKLNYKDIDGILSWMHDDSINCFFANNFKDFTRDDVQKFIDSCATDTQNLHYACVDDSDKYLGTVSLKNIDHKNKNAEYAVSFCKFAQGTGAAKFATEEIVNIAFNDLGLEKVYINVLAENLRANNFYKKMGFTFEGTFKRHIFVNGELKDLNWYGVFKAKSEKGGNLS